jgi:hypothetical protein
MATEQNAGSRGQAERQKLTADLPSREERIAAAAYRRATERDFEPGFELDDWLSAEREIDEQIADEQLRATTPSMR